VVPPLRKRKDDIMLLAKHYIRFYSNKYLKPALQLSGKALDKLLQYPFPGNVRELQYAIERAVIMAESNVLEPDDILFSPLETTTVEEDEVLHTNLGTLEKNTILKVIEKNNGNISKAAKELGITRTALYRRLSKYDI
jgi:transcriptional regulator with PAS, ATPase and Fis domain